MISVRAETSQEYEAMAAPAAKASRPIDAPQYPITERGVVQSWVRAQGTNARCHLTAMRPFKREEFGSNEAAPTVGHIQAANALLSKLRSGLASVTAQTDRVTRQAELSPTPANLQRMLHWKEQAHSQVQRVEKVWDFYFELFGQRQSQYGDWLVSCDRIALDCYQRAFTHIGVAKSVPSPPPFVYMRTGFSPATYRRGIRMTRLGKQINPFPLIELPLHRLVNPWTLGAILHEVSHNLQNDLGLQKVVPYRIAKTLLHAGMPQSVAMTWARWNRELFADVSGLLLGGPAVVTSLFDVIGRSPEATLFFIPGKPHPTPYLRSFLSIEVLRRMGFPKEAAVLKRTWSRLYPNPERGNIPAAVLATREPAIAAVVDAVCFQPFDTLGGKTLAQVMGFDPKYQAMVEEAAERLAKGIDPGIVPERFLIGASRFALDKGMASPEVIAKNFYIELSRR